MDRNFAVAHGCLTAIKTVSELLAETPGVDLAEISEADIAEILAAGDLLGMANEAAVAALADIGWVEPFSVIAMGEGTIDDLGVWFDDNGRTGEYPVNHKGTKAKASKAGKGKLTNQRGACRNTLLRAAIGRPKRSRVSRAKLDGMVQAAIGAREVVGYGILSITSNPLTTVRVYDLLHVAAYDVRPCRPVVDKNALSWEPIPAERLAEEFLPMATSFYLKENGLVQVTHSIAEMLWEQLLVAAADLDLQASDSLRWFLMKNQFDCNQELSRLQMENNALSVLELIS